MSSTDAEQRVRIDQMIKSVAVVADRIPGVILIHELPEFTLRYMSKKGLELLGKKWEEVEGLSGEAYHARFFNKEHFEEYVPKILRLLESNTDETVSFFQQVRTSKEKEWDWYMSLIKIFMRDDEHKPLLTITTSMQVDPEHYFTAKAARLLTENEFLRSHFDEFATLTRREREILKLIALGKTSSQIASVMNLSTTTIETHRKNIKRKIDINSVYDLSMYARAFDLV